MTRRAELKALFHQTEQQLTYSLRHVGSTVIQPNHWATLMELSHAIHNDGLKGSGLGSDTRHALTARFDHLMHDLSRSYNNIDMQKRDQQVLVNEIRALPRDSPPTSAEAPLTPGETH